MGWGCCCDLEDEADDFAFRLLEQKDLGDQEQWLYFNGLSFNLLNKTSEKRDGSIFSDFMDDNVDIKDISACISLPTEDFWVVVESAVLSKALPIAREETFYPSAHIILKIRKHP